MKFLNITAANYLTGSGLLYSVNSFVNDNMNFFYRNQSDTFKTYRILIS